jgi:hypothetical protein
VLERLVDRLDVWRTHGIREGNLHWHRGDARWWDHEHNCPRETRWACKTRHPLRALRAQYGPLDLGLVWWLPYAALHEAHRLTVRHQGSSAHARSERCGTR